ncbi:MAG: amidohydrolase family protein [Geminicoccaceae bacterium]|nr:amidohydrolase family protein [Geminicoccaceae bacterium]
MQTHLAESVVEVARVRELFPWARHYTEVYDRFGLLGGRSLFAHCIHLAEEERVRLAATGSVAVLCPTSNFFLGSGLVEVGALAHPARPVRCALGTDVGGGTSWSMLRTAAALHDLARLRGHPWGVVDAFRLITAGNAEALGLGDRIGRLEPGFEADLVVLEPRASCAMAHRLGEDPGLEEELAVLLWLADERAVWRVYLAGEPMAGTEIAGARHPAAGVRGGG